MIASYLGRQRYNIALALLLNPHLFHAISMALLGSLYLVETYVIAKQYRQMGWTTSSKNINYGPSHIIHLFLCSLSYIFLLLVMCQILHNCHEIIRANI